MNEDVKGNLEAQEEEVDMKQNVLKCIMPSIFK